MIGGGVMYVAERQRFAPPPVATTTSSTPDGHDVRVRQYIDDALDTRLALHETDQPAENAESARRMRQPAPKEMPRGLGSGVPAAAASSGARVTPRNDEGYTPGHDGTYSQNYQDVWFEVRRCTQAEPMKAPGTMEALETKIWTNFFQVLLSKFSLRHYSRWWRGATAGWRTTKQMGSTWTSARSSRWQGVIPKP